MWSTVDPLYNHETKTMTMEEWPVWNKGIRLQEEKILSKENANRYRIEKQVTHKIIIKRLQNCTMWSTNHETKTMTKESWPVWNKSNQATSRENLTKRKGK